MRPRHLLRGGVGAIGAAGVAGGAWMLSLSADFAAMQLEYPTESRRAVRERANAFGQTDMTRSLR
jgi:hypothetical protein